MHEDKNFKQKIKKQCLDALEELKAQNIKTLNVEKSSSFTSIIIIATGTSNRHIQSISDKVFKNLKDSQFDIIGKPLIKNDVYWTGFENKQIVL